MKHKAQESLDYIAPIVIDDFDGTVRDYYNEEVGNLEDLINCQLTVEEIEMLQDALLVIKQYRKSKYRDIKIKLQKQKEMWVIDDETN